MKGLKKIMNSGMTRIMLDCDKATLLISKKEVVELKCIERTKLKMHLITCKYCRRFAEQSKFISNHISSMSVIDPNNLKLKLTDSQKADLQKNIDDQLNSS